MFLKQDFVETFVFRHAVKSGHISAFLSAPFYHIMLSYTLSLYTQLLILLKIRFVKNENERNGTISQQKTLPESMSARKYIKP